MQNLRTIKVFLASSEELENDRDAIGNLVRRLNEVYEKRGMRVDLFEWEDYDASYCGRPKQDEYNDRVRASDMFIALFHIRAGKYTLQEFDVATEEFKRTGKMPKPYVYCHDLASGEQESAELAEFKQRLFKEMGHYWCRYGSKDTLKLHFAMQLQLVESSRLDEVKVEDGHVTVDGLPIVRMGKLGFASGNPDYQRMHQRLSELPTLIEEARFLIQKYPDEEKLQANLQRLLDERNQLQEDFDRQQKFLLDTAKTIARLQGETITDRMRRAIEAFEMGQVQKANIILAEAEYDAERNLEDYLQSKEVTEQKRQTVIHSIEEILLKTSILMADGSIKIEDRINQVAALYAQVDRIASKVEYDKEKYAEMLSKYEIFLYNYGRFEEALKIGQRNVSLMESLYGKDHPDTATSYNNVGLVYSNKGDYPRALEYHEKALAIRRQVLGENHPNTATSYNNIGLVYANMGDYPRALEYYEKSLEISIQVLGENHPDTATSYNNIGSVYDDMADYPRALEYYKKALAIEKQVLGENHPNTAGSYNNIGVVYAKVGEYPRALDYEEKALAIEKQVLGENNPDTATSYNNIGLVYSNMGEYPRALEYYEKALAIRKQVLGEKHSATAISYNNIGSVYFKMGDYPRALEYFEKALAVQKQVLGENHPKTIETKEIIQIIRNAMS